MRLRLAQARTPAVLLVTHDVDEAILLADRVIVLENGKIAEQLRIDLPRARDTGQEGFQAIRARLLGLLGVQVEAAAARSAEANVRRLPVTEHSQVARSAFKVAI